MTGVQTCALPICLVSDAAVIITDSGGVQEETTYLGIPCLTLRDTTERPVTVTEGTNRLLQAAGLRSAVREILGGAWRKGRVPALWDGHSADRVVASLKAHNDVLCRKTQATDQYTAQ